MDSRILVPLLLNGSSKVNFELDTGASVSVISEKTWRDDLKGIPLKKSGISLRTYTGKRLKVVGKVDVNVEYEKQTASLPLHVLEGNGPSLLGRNWLRSIQLNWGSIKRVVNNLDELLDKHREVFQDELGVFKNVKAKLHIKPDVKPKYCKPRSVPYALREPIERGIERLVEQGVLEKVEYSDWAAPIVPVMKPDGSVRICGDYKVTVNPYLEVDKHPLPKAEDLFVELSGGEKFTKLDLKNAYNQIMLDESSREYVTINTHRGLYRPRRLPYGVAPASAIFQSKMEQLLQGIPMVVCRVDDILVSGNDDDSHLAHLDQVLTRLGNANLRLKLEKCKFMQPSVEYLGYLINAQGLHTTAKKVKAISEAPIPTNVQKLRAFLGMLNYFSKFVHNHSITAQPLTDLLKRGFLGSGLMKPLKHSTN